MDMELKESIVAALQLLDDDNDEHWTSLGLPSVDAVNDLVGGDEKITRAMISEAFPNLKRHLADDIAEAEAEIDGHGVPEDLDGYIRLSQVANLLDPLDLIEMFCKAMKKDNGKWQRYCPPLSNIMQQYMASEPSIKDHVTRAKSRGRL